MSLETWERIYGKQSLVGAKTASINKFATQQSKFILSHCSIMASVHTEYDPFEYRIRPESAAFVNANNDGWENRVLKAAYPTFRGGFNFVEHYQNSKANKGHILDAVLRKVNLTPQVYIYYVDILVATDLAHEELCEDIRSGKTRYMSMGCVTDLIICSYCGAHVTDTGNYCIHLRTAKGTFIADEDGIPRRVAELCGHHTLPNGGVKFVESSWVKTPAFAGASRRNIVSESWLGPKTPFTAVASLPSGLRKAASLNPLPSRTLTDSALMAALRRQIC